MKILLVHNFYGSAAPSGENHVFEAERTMLEQRGHEVQAFTRHSDEIRFNGTWGVAKGACSTPWNPWMANSLRRFVENFQPDVVHVHNTFPLLSPAIFHAIGTRAACVLTLHNYRIFCPAGIPMRAGKVCTECLDCKSPLPSLKFGCYRRNHLATVPLAISVGLHRLLETWTRKVDGFINLSVFQQQRMVEAGLPRSKCHVKANFFPGQPNVTPWSKRKPYVVFVGRLSAEKGVHNLLRAWQSWGKEAPELRLVGDGELKQQLERMSVGLPVRFLGQIPPSRAQSQIAQARLLVLPSEWFETFGLVVMEALALGTPAAVSNLGSLPSIVKDGESGVVFQPADPDSLLNTVRNVWKTPGLLEKYGKVAREIFEDKYTESVNYNKLMAIYEKAIVVNRKRAAR